MKIKQLVMILFAPFFLCNVAFAEGNKFDRSVVPATIIVCSSNIPINTYCDYTCDGTADNIEIQTALDSLPVVGSHCGGAKIGIVQLTVGQYHLADGIKMNGGTTLQGISSIATVLFADQFLQDETDDMIGIRSGSLCNSWYVIRDLGLWGNSNHSLTRDGILFGDTAVQTPTGESVPYGRNSDTDGNGINLSGAALVRIENVRVKYMPGNGVRLSVSNSQVVSNCYFTSNRRAGIYGGTEIIGCLFERNSLGIRLGTGTKVIGSESSNNLGQGIYAAAGISNAIINGCVIQNNWKATAVGDFTDAPTAGLGLTNSIGSGSYAMRPGVQFVSGANNVYTSNILVSDGVNGTKYGIRINSPNSIVANNTFSGVPATGRSIRRDCMAVNVLGNLTDDAHVENRDAKFEALLNSSGGSVVEGDVVVHGAESTGDSFKTTTTGGDVAVLGIVQETIANGSIGYVQTLGFTDALKVDGTDDIAIGDFISTFTTAKIGKKAGAGNTVFAIALEAYTNNDSLGVIDAILVSPR